MLLHFAHAVTRRGTSRVEAFLFSTELTRITRQLRVSGPDDALGAVSRAVPDWSGGTRIGGAVQGVPSALEPPRAAAAVPWSCSSPMDGIAAIRRELRDRIARLSEAAID